MNKIKRVVLKGRMLLVAVFVLALITEPAPAGELEVLVPTATSLEDIKSLTSPRQAEGEDLFKLINGGAVLFFQHQFKRALFQEYTMDDGKLINLEIYQMGTPAMAQAIFRKKRGEQGTPVAIGKEAILADYYLLFRQGPYFVTITGDEATKPVRQALIHIGHAVTNNIMDQPVSP